MTSFDLGQVFAGAMQSVMDLFSDRVEFLPTSDDVPARVNPQFFHEGDQAVQDLRHAAAHRGGIDVADHLPFELLTYQSQVIDSRIPNDRGIRLKHAELLPAQRVPNGC